MERSKRILSRPVALLSPALVALALQGTTPVRAQTDESSTVKVIYRGESKAVRFDVSPPLRSMPVIPPKESEERDFDERNSGLEGPLGPQDVDRIVQRRAGTNAMPAPILSFNGQANVNGVAPPDPNGDVGLNNFVAMANLTFTIYNKTGGLLFGPANINTLWAGFGGDCQTDNSGDPIVLYDQLADRWILSQFTASGPTFFNCVAVSTTGDPTGSYFRYAFTTGTNFPDYPKYGIWTDALYIATREFAGGPSGPFAGVGAYAVNRAQLLA